MVLRGDNTKNNATTGATKKQTVDLVLVIHLIVLCAFGVIMLTSASYYSANITNGDGLYYLKKQLVFLAVGGVAMFALSRIDIRFYRRDWVVYGVAGLSLLLMLLALVQGKALNGATRWLNLGFTSIQPSEFAKFTMPLLMSYMIAKNNKQMGNFLTGTLPILLIMVAYCGVLGLQRNLSMLIIFACTGIVMLYFGCSKWNHMLIIFAMFLTAAIVLVLCTGFRMNRFAAFFDPWSDPTDKGYQVIQSLYAHASGGLFGTGLTFSKQKLLFLGYSETDYIYSIICEELGFVGGLLLILLYYFIFRRIMRIAANTKSRFGSLYASSVAMILAMQTIIHIGVSCNVLPSTGQTLPFISAGGSSLIAYMAAFGIILSISKTTTGGGIDKKAIT